MPIGLKPPVVPLVQAEVEAGALSEVSEANVGELATKGALQHLEERFDANLQRLEERFDAKLERFDVKLINLKFELLKWLIGLIVVQTCLLIALLNFFRSVRKLLALLQ